MGEGKGWTTVQAIASLAYPYFESLVWKQFGKRIRAREYDVVHRITPLSPTVASLLAPKCQKAGVPFVLGPLNGGVPWPREFESERRREREWLSYVRSAYKLLPGPRRTMASSAAIICGSRHTQSEVPAKHRHRSIYLVENAIDPKRFFRLAIPGRSGSPLRVAFLGRMVPYKGPDMLIEAALPLVDSGSVQLEMIGDGPLLPAIREMAASRSGITFHGWLQHEKIQDILVNCDLLALPSVREFGGGVVLEAMALGVPPLVVDYAGPGELVNDDRGFKVPLTSRQALIGALHQQIRQIAENPSQLAAKGDAARSWVLSTATWDSKAGQVVQVYDWVMKRREDKPDFSGLFR